MNTTSLGFAFDYNINGIFTVFNVSKKNLRMWDNTENRATHKLLLSAAYAATIANHEYAKLLDNKQLDIGQVGEQLGFDNPLNLSIEGLSSRTFRSWCDVDDKRSLAIAVLLGLHWLQLTKIAVDVGLNEPVDILNLLAKIEVGVADCIRLYQLSPTTMVKLLSRCAV